jgi:hypothetical protein
VPPARDNEMNRVVRLAGSRPGEALHSSGEDGRVPCRCCRWKSAPRAKRAVGATRAVNGETEGRFMMIGECPGVIA